ncbi:class I SAM-dependent DNA methyltransferase [Deinococcus aquiradiocola]|uniref:site-specific DNA-methyltransferase (adenine-specific) n=1 Tax=Deinococcus aquiradiocola TaxID=393059 RepID=A0A917P7H2_9DEIO|nr:class I SAM-dependent DNA methyltransferase [Deinococcus aquiradiocola]GGJ65531.1 hypothetical protein GCM10008939_06870 [Deinococcus aquiradiocola]
MPTDPHTFIARWKASGGSERANYASFLIELCELLDVPRPAPATATGANEYVFEREVREVFTDGSHTTRFLDLYRKGSFVLETKQGVEAETAQQNEAQALTGKAPRRKRGHGVRGTKSWDTNMVRAKEQAEAYVRFLPADEGRPPFVLVVDVGHVIEVYSEFSRSGGTYLPFPNALTHRIPLEDLARDDVRERLRAVWLDPMSLDPSRHAARVTRAVTAWLAEIGRSLEASRTEDGEARFTAEQVSTFLMRMIFTMFAEDMDLIPKGEFTKALTSLRGNPEAFVPLMEELWGHMAKGGFSAFLRAKILHFNGGLFEKTEVLPVTAEQLDLLIHAAESDWSEVEPSIFGTLVERALDARERHRLGAHYTPRAYVERLVNRVVMDPLREDWRGVLVEVQRDLEDAGETADTQRKGRLNAVGRVEAFLARLQQVRVLDPACGTGNFLYVSMELIKRLESEAQEALVSLGGQPQLIDVSPENFLGLEMNARAASVASLVLWIGYLQIYARTHQRHAPPEPILKALKNIRQTDAVLSYRQSRLRKDKDGKKVMHWDGVTRVPDPASGRSVPDLRAQVPDREYVQPSRALWPEATFIVGNPPFIGAGPMRETLGDGYVDALRSTYKPSRGVPGVPDSSDFVMYWWHKAAAALELGRSQKAGTRRFGFVTTNSIKQTFNRRVVEDRLRDMDLSLVYAVPDHPWVDEADGAAVRIAMTVVERGQHDGVLERVVEESVGENGEYVVQVVEEAGRINADLTTGTDITRAVELKANEDLSNRGVQLIGNGFIVTREQAAQLGLGRIDGLENHIREYRNGRDLTSHARDVLVIDLFGLTETEVRDRFPEVYQHLLLNVKPERDQNKRASYRENWWVFGEPRSAFRPALLGLNRYIATVETSKHRFFRFLDSSVLPDNKLIAIAHDDAFVLGVLSSNVHTRWAVAQGSNLGVGNDPVYVKTRCFETFPFPAATASQKATIRAQAQLLDDHRQTRLTLHPDIGMTDLYNVLEKLRKGETLSAKEQDIHDRGLVSTLRALHDELDARVADAYGWAPALPEQQLLGNLMALNEQRAAEERRDVVQWLRPEYQNPASINQVQEGLGLDVPVAAAAEQVPTFPARLAEQSRVVRQLLRTTARPLTAQQVAKSFKGVGEGRAEELLETLVALGQARQVPTYGAYTA